MNLSSKVWLSSVAILGCLLGGTLLGVSVRSCCEAEPSVIVLDVDAGPGNAALDKREAAAAAELEARLRAIEVKRQKALDALDAEGRAEYSRVRERGPEAVLEWLRDFDRERFR